MLRRTVSFLRGAGPMKTKVLKFHSVFDQRLIFQSKDNCTAICSGALWQFQSPFQRTIASDSKTDTGTVLEGETSSSSFIACDNNVTEEQAPLGNIADTHTSESKFSCVYMRGLPYSITKDDIVKFFAPLGISPSKVALKCDRYGFTNGKAEVEFESSAESSKALQKQNHYIGHRYVELSLDPFPQMSADRSRFRNPGLDTQQIYTRSESQQNPFARNPSSHVVKLSGLPFSANSNDIYKFFEPLNIVPIAVQLQYTSDGYPVGICYVTFKTEADSSEALKNNNKYIGDRYIRIFLLRSSQAQLQHSDNARYDDKRNFKIYEEDTKSF